MVTDHITQDEVDSTLRAHKEETDKNDTSSLAHLANTCAKQLHTLAKEEESNGSQDVAQHGYWASRQLAEYNIWCSNIGMHSEGSRSIDVRLKDVPEICKLLKNLLESLRDDLNELQSPAPVIASTSETEDLSDDANSEISFRSLSSSDDSEEQGFDNDNGAVEERNVSLQIHISDTIDRLQELARQIQRAGAQHRRQRVDLYREKERPKQVYEGFKKLGLWKANDTFKSATDKMKTRTAESFARRRIRFEYLKAHQKKRALQKPVPQPQPMRGLQTVPEHADVQPTPVQPRPAPNVHHGSIAPYPEDQKTVFSATVHTKFNFRPELKMKQRAESVRSVAIRNTGFPPPPEVRDGSFQCPYCRLTFGAREAEAGRWSQHVMQDFEPYFCTFEDCEAPFDVPNSFDGLLEHMQTHVPIRLHVEESDGHHKEYLEEEFEEHMGRQMEARGDLSVALVTALKEDSRRRGAFLFEDCPFCGGYPDVVEKRFPDPSTIEAQSELRRHIKQHMQEITLFLPPYRSDIVDNDDDTKGSDFAERQSVQEHIPENLDDFVAICDREHCDCKDARTTPPKDVYDKTDFPQGFWSDLFDDAAKYDRSPVSNQELWSDPQLRTFIAHEVAQTLSTNDANYDWFESKVKELSASDLPLLFVAYKASPRIRQSLAIVQQLIAMGADFEVKDDRGYTLLSQSAADGHFDLTVYLIMLGANVNSLDNRSRSPLALATLGGYLHVMKELLDSGADVNTKDRNGQTPLALACERNILEAVALLLDHGADINITDNRGFQPVDKARVDGFYRLYDLLVERGAVPKNDGGELSFGGDQDSNIRPSATASIKTDEKAGLATNRRATMEREIAETQNLDQERIHESAVIQLDVDSEAEDTESLAQTSEHGPSQSAKIGSRSNLATRDIPSISSNDTISKNPQADFETNDPEKGGHLVIKSNEELPFDFISDLGMGALAKVSHVRSKVTLKAYALKKMGLPKSGPRREQVKEAFRYEARLSHRISHRHVIRVVGSFESDLSAGLLIVPIAERDLAQYLRTNPAKHGFTNILKTFFGCLATGLEYLHSVSIIHNDITPQNILVRNGTVLISGFGTAIDGDFEVRTKSPRDSMCSPRYCSPEKSEHDTPGYPSDIWSLGCVFVEMMAAIQGMGADELRSRYSKTGSLSSAYHKNSEATSQLIKLWKKDRGTSPWLVELIGDMLMSQPQRRPPADLIVQFIDHGSQSLVEWCGSCCAPAMPASQERRMVMPDRIMWVYRDPQGNIQGPFSGLEMHDWYSAGFFSPELLVKKIEDASYEPLAQMIRRIGNSREPFLVPQIGVIHSRPSRATESQRPPIIPRPPAPRISRIVEEAEKGQTAALHPFSQIPTTYRTEQEDQTPAKDNIPPLPPAPRPPPARPISRSLPPPQVPTTHWKEQENPNPTEDNVHLPLQSRSDAEEELGIRHNVDQLHRIIVENLKSGMDRTIATMCMKMFDNNEKGYLLTDEVRAVLKFLTAWRSLFDQFVQDFRADYMLYDHFSKALIAFGYRVSPAFTLFLFNTFAIHSQDQELFDRSIRAREISGLGEMTFERFVQACIVLKRGTDAFKKFDDDRDGYITLRFEDFLDCMVQALPHHHESRTTQDEAVTPYGAITTPPDSSDEDENEYQRGVDIGNLRDLNEALKQINARSDQGIEAKPVAAAAAQNQPSVAERRSDYDLERWVGGFQRPAPTKPRKNAKAKENSANEEAMEYLGSKTLIDPPSPGHPPTSPRLGGFRRPSPSQHRTSAISKGKSVEEEPIEYLGSKALMDDAEDSTAASIAPDSTERTTVFDENAPIQEAAEGSQSVPIEDISSAKIVPKVQPAQEDEMVEVTRKMSKKEKRRRLKLQSKPSVVRPQLNFPFEGSLERRSSM